MEISALTRSVIKQNHALISPDGYIGSKVPGWDDCTVNVIISEKMGANLCQTMITAAGETCLKGRTTIDEILFYVISGQATGTVDGKSYLLGQGGFLYIPPSTDYVFDSFGDETKLLTFHKKYQPLDGTDYPDIYTGNAEAVAGQDYLNDPALQLQVLLPDDMAFDMAVNIFTYQPGGHLPMVETHVMEHGLLYLQGQGIYRLEQDWYPVKKGDSIWMAPYCQQWFTAMGKEPAVYIYYKDVNRQPFPF